jgi:FixJ family two-component response regulator
MVDLCPIPLLEAQPPLVVVMDDDPSIRRALERLLRSAGLSVETFASAAELLARASPLRPTCLVLDIHLPDMNGLDVLRRITAVDRDLPVLIVTGALRPELREQALQAGAAAFLSKPFDEDQLLEEIRRALLRSGSSAPSPGMLEERKRGRRRSELDADLAG